MKRRSSTKAKVMVQDFDEIKQKFLQDVNNIIAKYEIPADMIINWDQTGVKYIPVASWTMEREGSQKVEIVAKDDKRQITAVLAGSLKGDFLPLQIIYEGKTSRCLPAVKFPPDWHGTFSENHWSNEETMRDYLVKVLIPYIQEKRKNLQLSTDYPALMLFDNFNGQCTESLLKLLDVNNINLVIIPVNWIDQLQPMDISVNKSAKEYLRKGFQEWYP